MLPSLFAVSVLSLLGLGDLTQWLTYGAVGVGVYLLFSRFGLGESLPSGLAKLPERASNLLRHIDSLGLPVFATLLRDVAAGNWAKIPADVHGLLDALDDKKTRGAILDTLFEAQLARYLADPAKKALLAARLRQEVVTVHVPDPFVPSPS